RVINNIKRAGMNMVTNPLDNAVLQGRFDSYPIRRGHTRVKELLAAGINTCIGHDAVMDPWYPLGYGDPLQAAFVLAHYGQMSGAGELRTLIDMITGNPAQALGVENYGLATGIRPGLVAYAAPTARDAIRPGVLGRLNPLPPMWLEGRLATEYVNLIRDPVFYGRGVAGGDGRPVLLIPGFLAGDQSLITMRDWLRRMDYRPELSGIRFN